MARLKRAGCLSLVLLMFASLALAQTNGRVEAINAEAEFKMLDREYKQAEDKFYEPIRKSNSDADPDMTRHPVHTYTPRFRKLELRARGTAAGACNGLDGAP